MALPIFGAQAAVSIVNRALSNSSPAHNVYLNQVSNAGVSASSEYAFAGQLGASYAVGKTPAELAEMILANVGISATTIPAESYDILLAAGTDYIAFHGTQNIGIIALQFGQIISGLENDVTFGNAAKAWNAEVLAAYNYSTNPANGTTQTGEGVPGNSNIILTVGQDNLAGSGADDTFKANVSQNALGQQVNTLGSGDILEGGAGFDTLDAKITNGSFVGGSISQPIQPETNSIEYIKLQAVLADVNAQDNGKDQVYVNAKDMVGVKTISSNYSDASLTIMNLTTKGSAQLSDLTVNMSYTGNADSAWDESNFKVLFDQDYLTPETTLGTATVDFLAMNEDNYDASNGENPLTGVFFRTLNFTLNGVEYNLAAYLGEDATGAGDEINTYQDFLDAVTAGLVALKADHPENAALQSVQASFGRQFTTDVNPVTLELREGTAIRLTADGQTNGVANTLYVDSTDLEVARAGQATVPNNNRYEIADATPPLEGSKLGINVELEKVGLAGDGGALVIGSMNKADDDNIWDTTNTTVAKTTNGINEFYVTVKGNADKSSSLSELRSTNNQLKVVTVKTDAAQTGTFANLTIGNDNTSTPDGSYVNSLKDVQTFDASGFKGDLSLQAALTSEVVAKYLDLKDQSPAEAAADNAAFVYTGGTGNDTIDLQVTAENFAFNGTATREDFSVNLVGGAGNDEIILTVVQGNSDQAASSAGGTSNWYVNQVLNANLRINAGEGNDIIRTPGSGNVIIDAGSGDDTVYADNTGGKAAWVLNATLGQVDLADIQSSANNSYNLFKGEARVTFKGFEAQAVIADRNGVITDLSINQAIKKAINDNAVLNKLLVAEDGPANTLVITSLIDGAPLTAADLGLSLVAPTTLTSGELAQLNTWYGISNASVATNAVAADAFNNVANTTYLKQLATSGGTDVEGSISTHTSDNTITGGLGNDVLVLGTGLASNDTLVYTGYGNGTDSIVNFTATIAPPVVGAPAAANVAIDVTVQGDVAVQEEFEAVFTPEAGATAYTFDGVTVNVAAGATPASIAAAFDGFTSTNWTATANGSVVTFVAVLPGNPADAVATDFSAVTTTVTGNGDFIDFSSYGAVAVYVGGSVSVAGVYSGGTLFEGAAPVALGDKYITLIESSTNPGSYTVQEWTEAGALGGAGDTVQLIGVLDFGSTQAFTNDATFII